MSKISELMEIEEAMVKSIDQVITCTIVKLPLNLSPSNSQNITDLFLLRSIISNDYLKCPNSEQKESLMNMFIHYNQKISEMLGLIVVK
jgi:hypothetical protein